MAAVCVCVCVCPTEGGDKCFDRWLPWFSLTAEPERFWVPDMSLRARGKTFEMSWSPGGENEYRIMSTVPLRFKSAAIRGTYYCFSPCPTSVLLATLRFCCSPPSSSSLFLYFHFSFACYQPSLCSMVTPLISQWGCEKEHQDAALFCSMLTLIPGGWEFTENKMCRRLQPENTEQRRDIEKM